MLSDISGSGLDNLSLIQSLRDHHIRRRVAKEQESWVTAEDVFKSINRITRTEEQMKAYHELKYDSISQVSTEKIHEVSNAKYNTPKTPNNSYNRSHFRNPCNSNQFSRNQGKPQYIHTPSKPKCYHCEGKHHINECKKFKQDKAKYKLKTVNIIQNYKDKIVQKAKKDNISINEAMFLDSQHESTYCIEQAEQLLGNMHFSNSGSELEWLDKYVQNVIVDEVNSEKAILYKVKVNGVEVEALYDMCVSFSVMSKCFLNRFQNKLKLLKHNRNISGAGGKVLVPSGECFIQLQIGNWTFCNRVIVIANLMWNYIPGQVLQRANRFGTSCSTAGRHYITINGEMIAQSISCTTVSPRLKIRGKVMLPPMSVSVVGVNMPEVPDINNLYELNFDTFQLSEGVIPLDVLYRIDHKTPKHLYIPILNTNNTICSLTKYSAIAMLAFTGKCEQIQEIRWTTLHDNATAKLFPKIPDDTNLQLEPDTNSSPKSIPDTEIPDEARDKLKELLDVKYANIVSQTAIDTGRTNLTEVDIPTEGPPIASKLYTLPLKYWEFVDHEIKQL